MDSGATARLGRLLTVDGADGSVVTVSRHGGHVVSWRTADGRERLFLSDRATTAAGAAIRGGIPVCFPQFAGNGPLPKHGFARTAEWSVAGPSVLTLDVGGDDWTGWSHACRLSVEVLLGPSTLTTILRVGNVGGDELEFTGALHTYLACDDVTAVSVSGLDGRPVLGGGRIEGAIGFPDPTRDVDLSVLGAPGPVRVDGLEGVGGRSLVCAQTGFGDVVVWNIGETLGAAMADLGKGQWRNYVCVEAAAVGHHVRLAPGQVWAGSQTLTVV